MTFSLSAKLRRRRRKGPAKDSAVGAVVEEGDQGHKQGLHSLLGEPLWPVVAPQEAATVLLPTRLTWGTKSDTTMLILFVSTFPGNRRREGGAKQKRRGHWEKRQRGGTRDCRSSTGSKEKWLKRWPFLARYLWPLYKSVYRKPTTNCCLKRPSWVKRPHRRNLLHRLFKWYCYLYIQDIKSMYAVE